MKLIQLNIRPLPASPDHDRVFPYLLEDDTGGSVSYRLTFLIAKSNVLLGSVFDHLHFQPLPPADAIDVPDSLGLDTPADWQFLICGADGPFVPLTDNSGGNVNLRLSTYLTFAGLTADPVTVPTSITVVTSALHTDALRTDGAWQMEGQQCGPVADWTFKWANADATTDDTRVSFHLPILATGQLAGLKLGFAFDFSGDDGTAEENWRSGTLRARDVPIEGGQAERLYLGDAAFELRSDGLAYEADPVASLPLTGRRSLSLNIEVDILYVRFMKDNVAVHSYSSSLGAPLILALQLKFPLVMGRVTGGSPKALALMVPLLDDEIAKLLTFRMDLEIGEDWDADAKKIATYVPANNHWSLSDDLWDAASEHSWPILLDQLNDALELGGFDLGLGDLFGDTIGAVKFHIGPDPFSRSAPVTLRDGSLDVPMLLTLSVADNRVQFRIVISIDVKTFRLRVNKLELRMPPSLNGGGMQIIDLGVLALFLPERVGDSKTSSSGTDGHFDFEKREFVLKADRSASNGHEQPKPIMAIPGSLGGDLSQRLLFELQPFTPDPWPKDSGDPVYLRINPDGLSLYAKVITEHRPNVLRASNSHRALEITPLAEREDRRSEVVFVDNVIRKAVFFGELEVPSVDDLVAKIEVGMRQERRGQPPVIHAEVDLDMKNGKPIAGLSAGYLQMQIDDLRVRLEWNLDNDEWDLDVFADLSLFLSSEVSNAGGLDDLKDADRLQVRNCNLLKLHEGVGELSLSLARPLEFSCLDGKFLVTFTNVSFRWGDTFVLMCDEALFEYLDKGTLEVSVEVGGVHLEFSGGGRLKMRNPERIGIDVTVSDSVRYRGEVAWVDNDRERYFAAAGTLAISGLPEAATLLKLGTGRKQNGQIVPNIVLYGSLDYEMQLFSGVVAKNFGAGIGINNRLTGIPERPTAEAMLPNIDRIDPSRIDGWTFVERNGFYLSIVGTTIIASNTGGNSQTNAYVAYLLLSIDVDLNIVAAGKLWLASSVDFVRQRSNWNKPALVGAVAILPRDRLLTAAIESRPDPAIESSKQLQDILNKGHVKLSFTMSPKLVDFFLQDVSYRDEFLGVQMLYRGSFRLAYFDSTLMVRANQMITGVFSKELKAGPGGFRCHGDVAVGMEFGGLLSGRGIAAYGLIAARMSLEVNAWIEIGFSFTIGCGRWKKRISYSKTFRLPSTKLELGLRGAVAFDEGGSFGFAGEVSISISICGYRLSISPSLAFNDGVIKDVRQRVAAFEGRLEAYRQQLLTGGRTTFVSTVRSLESFAPEEPRPEWLHYRVGDWHLIIPPADELWFTPDVDGGDRLQLEAGQSVPFREYVRSIHFSDNDEPKLTLLMPWDQRNWAELPELPEASAVEPDALDDAETMMAETVFRTPQPFQGKWDSTATYNTGDWVRDSKRAYWRSQIDNNLNNAPADGGASWGNRVETAIPLRDYEAVSDPRVESSDREYWQDIDQVLLPEGVLPVRMKTAEQILQSGEAPQDFDSTYGRLVEYAWWSQRAIVQGRHQGADTSEIEDLEHRRAVVLFQLLTELRELSELSSSEIEERQMRSAWQAREISPGADGEVRQFGLVFKHPGELPPDVRIRRAKRADDDATMDTQVRLRDIKDEVEEARSKVHLLPPRQEYVVDQDTGEDARGRLMVRLPVRFENGFLQNCLPVTSHFQVWRRARGTAPVLIADQQLPPVTFLQREEANGPAIAVVDPYLATDEFPVDHDSRRILAGGISTGTSPIEYAIKLIPIGDFAPPSPPDDAVWQPVIPYLPVEDDFPVDLAIVLNADGLYRPCNRTQTGDSWTHFAFASIADEKVTLTLTHDWADHATPDATPRFEIWAEERPISDSGFYAGAAEEPGTAGSTTDADVRKVSAEESLISLDDKFRVGVDPVEFQEGQWEVSDESKRRFREGFGYLFYVRPLYKSAFGKAVGRVRPLRHYLSRKLPDIMELKPEEAERAGETHGWPEPPRLRAVGRLEWINADVVDDLRSLNELRPGSETPEKWRNSVSASVRPFDDFEGADDEARANQKRRIGIRWYHRGWQFGGVDLSIRDNDDSMVVSSRVCETSDAATYQQMIRDFSNDSAWRLTRRERSARLSHTRLEPVVPRPVLREHRVAQTLYLKSDNPVLRELSLRTSELKQTLNTAQDWAEVSVAAAEWIRALNAYDRSPLNLDDPDLEQQRLRARAFIRFLLMGLRPPPAENFESLTREDVNQIDETLGDVLVSVDEYQPDAADFDDSEDGVSEARSAFLDADFARKLAAVIRRRRIVAEDVVATVDDPLPRAKTEQNGDGFWLPRGAAFESLRQQQAEASTELRQTFTHVRSLLHWFPAGEARLPKSTWAADELHKTLDAITLLLTYNLDKDGNPDWDRREMASRTVAKAAGLTIAVQRLERRFAASKWDMERRPHHRVIVKTSEDGTKVPEPVQLRTLLSSADRATDAVGLGTGKTESSIVALFNLFERIGFAVDIAATDRLGQTVTQQRLLNVLREAGLEQFFHQTPNDASIEKHYVYVVTPREPDSEYRGEFPDAPADQDGYTWVGCSFVRLAVVPESFHSLVLAYLNGQKEAVNPDGATDLQDWLTMRGIGTSTPDELAKQIAPFARALDYAHPRDTIKILDDPKEKIVRRSTGNLLPLRLTPLELHYVTVPHLDGFAHVDWELPDRHGHRCEVSARAMSRYELLLRWADNSQRPKLMHAGAKVSVRRVMTRNDGIDLPIPQPVSVISHPSLVQFALTLAPAGIRSVLNRISAVRTGYQGYSLNFRAKLVDHQDKKLQWKQIRKAMVVETGGTELEDTPPVLIPTPRNVETDSRLYRHERLVQLGEVPYFYAVSLDAHSLFDGDLRGPMPGKDSGLPNIPVVDPAQRLPGVIAYRQPVVRELTDADYEIDVVLSRTGELARPQELTGGIPLEKRTYELVDSDGATVTHTLWDDVLPDPALGYHFYDRVDDAGDVETSNSIYRSVVDLLMPWHPGYTPPPPPNPMAPEIPAPARPLVRSLESDVKIKSGDEYPDIRLQRVKGVDLADPGAFVAVVTVKFSSDSMFSKSQRRRMQVSCRGRLTPPTDPLEES